MAHNINNFFKSQAKPPIFNQISQIVPWLTITACQFNHQSVLILFYVSFMNISKGFGIKILYFIKPGNKSARQSFQSVDNFNLMHLFSLILSSLCWIVCLFWRFYHQILIFYFMCRDNALLDIISIYFCVI